VSYSAIGSVSAKAPVANPASALKRPPPCDHFIDFAVSWPNDDLGSNGDCTAAVKRAAFCLIKRSTLSE
jgi:hypothetical protein